MFSTLVFRVWYRITLIKLLRGRNCFMFVYLRLCGVFTFSNMFFLLSNMFFLTSSLNLRIIGVRWGGVICGGGLYPGKSTFLKITAFIMYPSPSNTDSKSFKAHKWTTIFIFKLNIIFCIIMFNLNHQVKHE